MTISRHTTGPEAAQPVLFLHGFMGCGEDWAAIARSLPRYHCLLPDLPGHGKTPFPGGEHDLDALARDVLALAPANVKVHLVGYSMGGRLAFTMLRLFPQRIVGAFVISASPGIADPAARLARAEADERLARRLEQEPYEDFLTFWYALPLFSGLQRRPEARAAMLERRRRNAPRRLAAALRAYGQGRMTPCLDLLRNLRIPLHFEAGTEDSKYAAIAAEIRNLCPAAEICLCSGCSHAIPVEDADTLAARLQRWLSRC